MSAIQTWWRQNFATTLASAQVAPARRPMECYEEHYGTLFEETRFFSANFKPSIAQNIRFKPHSLDDPKIKR